MRDDRCIQPHDGAWPLATALGFDTELDTPSEQDLHPDAHPEHGAARSDPLGDDLVAADVAQSGHTGLVRTDTRYHQPVGARGRTGVGSHLDVGTHPLQRALRRPQIPGAVVEYDDGLRCHRLPLVDGTPVTRGSNSTAWRNARATALYCASVM